MGARLDLLIEIDYSNHFPSIFRGTFQAGSSRVEVQDHYATDARVLSTEAVYEVCGWVQMRVEMQKMVYGREQPQAARRGTTSGCKAGNRSHFRTRSLFQRLHALALLYHRIPFAGRLLYQLPQAIEQKRNSFVHRELATNVRCCD